LAFLEKSILPQPNAFPRSKYEASGTFKKFGLAYKVIDACVNCCMLFRGAHANVNPWGIHAQENEEVKCAFEGAKTLSLHISIGTHV
jgi:hypothetical protein